MKRFVEFSLWDYMDEFPRKEVRTYRGANEQEIEESARLFAKEMTKAYSGGTTTYVGIMSKEDAQKFVRETVTKEIEHPQEDSVEWIMQINNAFAECYINC